MYCRVRARAPKWRALQKSNALGIQTEQKMEPAAAVAGEKINWFENCNTIRVALAAAICRCSCFVVFATLAAAAAAGALSTTEECLYLRDDVYLATTLFYCGRFGAAMGLEYRLAQHSFGGAQRFYLHFFVCARFATVSKCAHKSRANRCEMEDGKCRDGRHYATSRQCKNQLKSVQRVQVHVAKTETPNGFT